MELDPEEQLHLQFLSTDEMVAWAEFQDDAQAAIDAGDETVTVSTAFLALILPEVKSSPFQFAALQEVWNRVCDEQGQPHLKKTIPETTEDSEDGPF